ncbi:hypothetical protein [Amycolatopsis sp. cmx-4-54]|uniref:hypothetical protein n=1 Tax=Amycolatopsis sp. cmx-4-54 TaxID=2790936 RepID=UPI00397E21B0
MNTSGPAAMSRGSVIVSPALTLVPPSPSPFPSFSFYLLKRTTFIRGFICGRPSLFSAIHKRLTCANISMKSRAFTQKDRQNSLKLTPETYCAAPGVELRLLCHRENRKQRQTTAPGANISPESGKPENT